MSISQERIEKAGLAVAECECSLLQFGSECAENKDGCVCRYQARRALEADAAALTAARVEELEGIAKIIDARAQHYASIANKHEGSALGALATHKCGALASISARISDRIRSLEGGKGE